MAGTDEERNKVVLVGDFEVGKTSLFMRFKTGRFEEVERQTRAEAECAKSWQVDGEDCYITLYDTAGMERFEATVPPTYFRNARAAILVYSIDNCDSIDDITHWAESMSVQRLGNAVMIRALVGNKLDLADKRDVKTKRGTDTADACDIDKDLVFEVSAKSGEGVQAMFDTIARKMNQLERTQGRSTMPQKEDSKCSC